MPASANVAPMASMASSSGVGAPALLTAISAVRPAIANSGAIVSVVFAHGATGAWLSIERHVNTVCLALRYAKKPSVSSETSSIIALSSPVYRFAVNASAATKKRN